MADPQERNPPSLEDEIFAMASTVEEVPAAAPRPPLRWDRAPAVPRRDLGAGGAGFGVFLFVDAIMMWAPLMNSHRPSLLPQMVTLLVLAFGLGGLLIWKVGGAWRPFALGMMASWVFLTLVSLGFLTGLTSL
ncbi:hypothetical protein [Actinomadura hibisca]|uniref:hypothetical protein n=1 Tax=Actinomadura hibisca TaxID=68565 RepID=UPI00082D0060|nr:hypothetical protein [Actinomadura hibisca]